MPVSAVASATERILDMMRYGHRSRTGRKALLPLRDIGIWASRAHNLTHPVPVPKQSIKAGKHCVAARLRLRSMIDTGDGLL